MNIINNLKAVWAWKYRLLLLVKLRISELNAWEKCCTGLSQYFTACAAPVFLFLRICQFDIF